MKHLPPPHPNRGIGPMNWDGHEFTTDCPCKPGVQTSSYRHGRPVAIKPDDALIQHRELPGQYGRTAEEIAAAEDAERDRRRVTPDLRRHVKSGARW